jgi:GT2 family glycosyltransferase
MKNYAIGIPTYNRFDLLLPAMLYYKIDFPNTEKFIVDNGNQNILEFIDAKIIRNNKNLGVAASWNQLCSAIFENHEYAIILNDDIYLGKTEWQIENLLKHYKSDIYVSEMDWSAFILPKKVFDEIGKFDENFFPAYFEDNDYEYRLKLKNKEILKIPFLNPLVFRASKTIEKDTKLNEFQKNKEYYIKKWGGTPGNEKYETN